MADKKDHKELISKADLDLWDELMGDASPINTPKNNKSPQRTKPDTTVDDFDEDEMLLLPEDMGYFEAFAQGKITLEDIPDKSTPANKTTEPLPEEQANVTPAQSRPAKPGFIIAENNAHKLAGWRTGVDKKIIKDMAQGKVNPSMDVDLHGFTLMAAYAEVRAFLAEARQGGHKCVLIIHGKGRREGREMGAIKQNLAGFLSERPEVLAFHTAHRRHGGSGACYVLIKKAK